METAIVAKWLYTTLSGDATLMSLAPGGVFDVIAPKGTAYPFVQFQFQAGTDLMVIGGYRVLVNSVWMVAVIAQTEELGDVFPAGDRIDALLHRQSGTVTGEGLILSCVRERPVNPPPWPENGLVYRRYGGDYRIQVQES